MSAKLDERHGRRVLIHENCGGWHYNSIQGICIAISARDEFMLVEVEYDPHGYWPVGCRVMVELGDGTSAYFASACTGITARWCPRCGDCACGDYPSEMNNPACPLHAPNSTHGEDDES